MDEIRRVALECAVQTPGGLDTEKYVAMAREFEHYLRFGHAEEDTLCSCGHPRSLHGPKGCLHTYPVTPDSGPYCPCSDGGGQ